jgi:hypothetical protein
VALEFNGISEKISLGIDVQSLWQEVLPILKSHKPSVRSPAVSGWALQAHPGAEDPLHAGWEASFCPYNGPGNQSPSWNPQTESEKTYHAVQDFYEPTPACTAGFLKILRRLEDLQLNPRRARIIRLSPASTMQWHRDGAPEIYQARLHIPLITNQNCFFENENGRFHMPVDGDGYVVHINRPHRAVNEGTEARFHFVTHIWDRAGITQFHRYQSEMYQQEAPHPGDCDLKQLFAVTPPTKTKS